MKITVIPATHLTPEHMATWSRLQRADPAVAGPNFRPEFTRAVASVRDDVEVAVLEEGNELVGFFPFQRGLFNVGKPVAGPLSNFHGIIIRKDVTLSATELIRGCRLTAWDFSHLVASQPAFQPHHETVTNSLYMDLSSGFEAYQSACFTEKSKTLQTMFSKFRKIRREFAAPRFEAHTSDKSVLDTLIDWKMQQYQATKVTNVFSFPWTVELLKRVLDERTEAFGGMLSAVYLDDRLAAIMLWLRADGILQGWFSAYNRAFYKYAPGMFLWMEIAKVAPSLGITRIDLGKGTEPYKARFMSGSIPVAEGRVECRPVSRVIRKVWRGTYRWTRSSPLRVPARAAARITRPFRYWLTFR